MAVAKNLEMSILLDFYGSMLTEKQQEVIEYYYNDDLSLSEIGENEGISRQGVHDAIKRAEAQLIDMEARLGLAKRFNEMKDGLERIHFAASFIRDFNVNHENYKEIESHAKQITEIVVKLAD